MEVNGSLYKDIDKHTYSNHHAAPFESEQSLERK